MNPSIPNRANPAIPGCAKILVPSKLKIDELLVRKYSKYDNRENETNIDE